MKRFVLLMAMLICTAMLLTACSESDSSDDSSEETTTTEETTTAEETTEESDKSLDGLKEYLLDSGVISGDESDVYYDMIDAIDGFEYSDQDVEIYEFDTTTDEYEEMVETMLTPLLDLDVTAINGAYVLIFDNDSYDQDIVDAFNEY